VLGMTLLRLFVGNVCDMNMYMIRICMDVCGGNDSLALVRGPPVLQVVYMRNVCDMNMYIMYMIRMCMG